MPAHNLKELIAWLKANADKATQGNSGVGSPSHVGGVMFQNTIGVRIPLVPFRSAGLTMQALLAGSIDIALDTPALSVPQVQGGNLKAYAVTAKSRVASLPDVPTTDEAGLPGFHYSFWHALWAPKGTPRDIVAKLNGAAVHALADPRSPASGWSTFRRTFSRPSSRRRRRSPPIRRPRSRSGGRSSRRPASRRHERQP